MSRGKAENGVVPKLFLTASEAMEFTGTSEGCGWDDIKQDQIEQGWQGHSNGKTEQYFLPYLIVSTLKRNFVYGKQTTELVSSLFDCIGSIILNYDNSRDSGHRNTRQHLIGRGCSIRNHGMETGTKKLQRKE